MFCVVLYKYINIIRGCPLTWRCIPIQGAGVHVVVREASIGAIFCCFSRSLN